jgi:hypothetical protein
LAPNKPTQIVGFALKYLNDILKNYPLFSCASLAHYSLSQRSHNMDINHILFSSDIVLRNVVIESKTPLLTAGELSSQEIVFL